MNEPDLLYVQFPYAYRSAFAARRREPAALPLTTERLLLWCRRDLYRDDALKAAWTKQGGSAAFGPPKTWGEYLRQAKFFKSQGAGLGILGILCPLFAFIWGWMKAKAG